jgi:hypothetical protein
MVFNILGRAIRAGDQGGNAYREAMLDFVT